MARFALLVFMILAFSGCSSAQPHEPVAPRQLIVAAVSMESHLHHPEQNLSAIEAWSRRAADAGAELALFPETALSGWWASREIRVYGEPVDGPSVHRLIALPGG
jgi:predicted amidohydrolase